MTKPSLALVVLLTGLVACSTDPKVKAEKYLARGDAYVAQHKTGTRSSNIAMP